MKKLAQALLNEYPNQEVVIFFNPYFVDGLIQIGAFTDADTLANAIFEMKQELAITEVLDINWFDVFLKNEPETLDTDWIDAVTNPRSQGCPRFQSGEELANSVGKINA